MAKSKKAFVDAVRAKGGVRYFDLGGGVGANTVNNGISSIFTPQSGYVAQLAPTTQLNYAPTVAGAAANAATGQQQFDTNLAAEQQLQGQLQQNALGQGPNPAQAALNQATGQNVANQAALAAGVRGSSQNPGLVAREAAQQGAAAQQQAVGQGATLQAQQQLAAQSALAGLQGQVGSQVTGQQNANANLLGVGAGANNAQNNTAVTNYGNAQGINAATAGANTAANQKTAGGILGGLASGIASLFAEGGEVEEPVQHFEGGGEVVGMAPGAKSFAGKFLSGATNESPEAEGFSDLGSAIGKRLKGAFSSPPVVSTPAESLGGVGAGSADLMPSGGVMTASKGKTVPGKAKVDGDSLKNDTVPAMLSPGEIVLPRHITQSANAPSKAAAFVQAILAKQGPKRGMKRG